MELQALLARLQFAKVVNYKEDINIDSIEQDTQKVTDGTLFICIEGDKFDGHQFAHEAVKKRGRCHCSEQSHSKIKCTYNSCKGHETSNGYISRCILSTSVATTVFSRSYWYKWKNVG